MGEITVERYLNLSASPYNFMYPRILTGEGTPGSAPEKVGDIFIDTTPGSVYISIGTSAKTDWVAIYTPV